MTENKVVDLRGNTLSAHAKLPEPHNPDETCANCHFSSFQGETGTCRANPPTIIPIPQSNSLGQVQIALHSIFPTITLDTWCCCFEPDADFEAEKTE